MPYFCPFHTCTGGQGSVGYRLYYSPVACCTASTWGDAPCKVRRSQACSCQRERGRQRRSWRGHASGVNMVSLATFTVALVGRLSGGRRPAYWPTFFLVQAKTQQRPGVGRPEPFLSPST
jgi:hypothetical protein